MDFGRLLNQTAVYWAYVGSDGRGGHTYLDGVEISCRWEEKMIKYINSSGEEKLSNALVKVASDVAVGGYLFLGELTDLASSATEDPTQEHDAYEIKTFSKIPSVRGSQFSRTAIL